MSSQKQPLTHKGYKSLIYSLFVDRFGDSTEQITKRVDGGTGERWLQVTAAAYEPKNPELYFWGCKPPLLGGYGVSSIKRDKCA